MSKWQYTTGLHEIGNGIYAYLQPDGSWGRAVSVHDKLDLPPVGQPALSHDGKYLFFCLAGDMYWVDAGFLEELRPDAGQKAFKD